MSFNQKKRNELELDELNIKSRLNTSLEREGISVSEDLINRTLNAIKQENVDSSVRIKKPIPFYRPAPTWAILVAAVLILVVGLNAAQLFGNIGMKEDMAKIDYQANNSDSGVPKITSDMAVQDMEADREGGFAEESFDDMQEEEDSVNMFIDQDLARTSEAPTNINEMLVTGLSLTFTDIAMIESADVSMITISSQARGEMKTLVEQTQIDDFYKILNEHLFMNHAGDDDSTQYIVKLISEDSDSQIIIGETSVRVDHTHNDIGTQSIYSSADQETLLESIKELLEK